MTEPKPVNEEKLDDSDDEDLFEPDPKYLKKSNPKINDDDDYDSMDPDLHSYESYNAYKAKKGGFYLLTDGMGSPKIFGCQTQCLAHLEKHPQMKFLPFDTFPESKVAGQLYKKLMKEKPGE